MSHSPEPWKPHQCEFIYPEATKNSCCGYIDGKGVVHDLSDAIEECGHIVDLEDMKRICACVNACHGVPLEQLLKVPQGATFIMLGNPNAEKGFGVTHSQKENP